MFHNYETEKITRKASDAAEYIELFGSSARDRHAGRIDSQITQSRFITNANLFSISYESALCYL